MYHRHYFSILILSCLLPLLSAQDNIPITRSICLLKSPSGSGSGFFFQWNNQDVLVTNNHVILELPDVRILDINGQEYKYDTIYASPDRDLAVIPLDRTNLYAMPALQLHNHPDLLPLNTPVTAYGNSLGDGVIVRANGKLLGIGPEVIEVDATFVSGNSGGPILDDKSGRVLGVATYCRILKSTKDSAIGSRFEATRYNPKIRRFATRIDNIKLESFEKLDLAQIKQDQIAIKELNSVFDKINQIFDAPESVRQTIFKLREILKSCQWTMPVKWHSTYMKKEAQNKWNIISNIRSKVGVTSSIRTNEDITPEDSEKQEFNRKISQILSKHRSAFRISTKKAVSIKCVYCSGNGVIRIHSNSDENQLGSIHDGNFSHAMKSSEKYEKCPVCNKKRLHIIRPEQKIVQASQPFYQELTNIITPAKQKFCGFQIGNTVTGWNNLHHGFYRNPYYTRKGIFTIYRKRGNHQINDATETRFWFIGSLLMRLDILLPATEEMSQESISRTLQQDYPELSNALFTVNLIREAPKKYVPVSNGGSDKVFSRGNIGAAMKYIAQQCNAASFDPFGTYYAVEGTYNHYSDKRVAGLHSAYGSSPYPATYRGTNRTTYNDYSYVDDRPAEKTKSFYMISFQHKYFEECNNLSSLLMKGLAYSENQSTNKPEKKLQFSNSQ